jgi:hypothetical protein
MFATGRAAQLPPALIEFMARYGSEKAHMPPDYRRELTEAAGFGSAEVFVLPRQLRLDLDAFVDLALSSSHAAGVIERFGADGRDRPCESWPCPTGLMTNTCYSATCFSASPLAARSSPVMDGRTATSDL